VQVLRFVVVASGAPHLFGAAQMNGLFGFIATHWTQQPHLGSAAQAVASLQHFAFAHAAHVPSLGSGGHTLPPVPVEALELDPDPAALDEPEPDDAAVVAAALDDAALDDAAELPVVPPPVQGAWHAPPTHCPNILVVPSGAPHWPAQACGSAFGWERQNVQQMQFALAVQAW
jgi:hypothetical protein